MAKGDRWVIEFKHDDDHYVAYGVMRERMRVYQINDGYHRKTRMWFPSCTKFMMYIWTGEWKEMNEKAIEKKYGPMVGSRDPV